MAHPHASNSKDLQPWLLLVGLILLPPHWLALASPSLLGLAQNARTRGMAFHAGRSPMGGGRGPARGPPYQGASIHPKASMGPKWQPQLVKNRWRSSYSQAANRPAAGGKQGPYSISILLVANPYWHAAPKCESNCVWNNRPLRCCTKQGNVTVPPSGSDCRVDAVWYYMPQLPPPFKPHRSCSANVPAVAFSEESAARYPWMNSKEYMNQFDVEQSYRVTAPMLPVHISMLADMGAWLDPLDARAHRGIFTRPIPTKDKVKAIVYLNSNCVGERNELVKRLMNVFPVHAYGTCLHNRDEVIPPRSFNNQFKKELFAKYRFCVAMENSVALDYVSEKVYESLTAGCLPLYLGPPNIQEFLPYNVSHMILDRSQFTNESMFVKEIQRLMDDDAAYDKYMMWRRKGKMGKPFHPAFDTYLRLHANRGRPMCQLCKLLASRKRGGAGTTVAGAQANFGPGLNSDDPIALSNSRTR